MEVGPETRTLGAAHGTSAPETPIAGNRQGTGRLARPVRLSRTDSTVATGTVAGLRIASPRRENGGTGPPSRPAAHA